MRRMMLGLMCAIALVSGSAAAGSQGEALATVEREYVEHIRPYNGSIGLLVFAGDVRVKPGAVIFPYSRKPTNVFIVDAMAAPELFDPWRTVNVPFPVDDPIPGLHGQRFRVCQFDRPLGPAGAVPHAGCDPARPDLSLCSKLGGVDLSPYRFKRSGSLVIWVLAEDLTCPDPHPSSAGFIWLGY